MNDHRKIAFFIVILFLLFAILLPNKTLAEIATTKDWIGLFVTSAGHAKTDTVNGTSWAYTNNCTKIADSTAPKISDPNGCTFATPQDGTYEYRMYAYDGENADALIAESNTMTVGVGTTAGGGGGGVPCPTQSPYPRVRNGLISAPNVGTNFGNNSGQCVSSNLAAFAPYKIPSYADLKSMYYTQSKLIHNTILPASFSGDGIYNLSSDQTISSPSFPAGSGTIVIFIEGKLTIGPITGTNKLGNSNSNLVFVVKGDVNIDPTIIEINAVIISAGQIYTAGANCTTNSIPASLLTINGSLISTYQDRNQAFLCTSASPPANCPLINLCRALNNNNNPAELVINQPKYLVILKDLYADTLQKWSEIQ